MAQETQKSLGKTLGPRRETVKGSGVVKRHRDQGLCVGSGSENISGEEYRFRSSVELCRLCFYGLCHPARPDRAACRGHTDCNCEPQHLGKQGQLSQNKLALAYFDSTKSTYRHCSPDETTKKFASLLSTQRLPLVKKNSSKMPLD